MSSGLEIERKFLLYGFPHELPRATIYRTEIRQAYMQITDNFESRVRQVRYENCCDYFITHKFNTTDKKVRYEDEMEINSELGNKLLNEFSDKSIFKYRYKFTHNSNLQHTHYVDYYPDFDLYIMEIEFRTKEEAEKYQPPVDCKEVTGSELFKNKNLAQLDKNNFDLDCHDWENS